MSGTGIMIRQTTLSDDGVEDMLYIIVGFKVHGRRAICLS